MCTDVYYYTEEIVVHGKQRNKTRHHTEKCTLSKHIITRKEFAIQGSKHGRHGKDQVNTKHRNTRSKMRQAKQNTQRHGTDETQRQHGMTRNERAQNKTQHGLERNTIM